MALGGTGWHQMWARYGQFPLQQKRLRKLNLTDCLKNASHRLPKWPVRLVARISAPVDSYFRPTQDEPRFSTC